MHIYIHVPFCARKCSYCDFAIAVRSTTPDASFVAAIEQEWTSRAGEIQQHEDIRSLYFGGGTPSRLLPASIAQLICTVTDGRSGAEIEITLEANPDDVTPARAAEWAAAGVNRVSLGVQSHNPGVLEWMHRTHQREQVAPAMAALRSAGITNISVDLIFALPDSLQRDWDDDLSKTLELEPWHVSLYGLTVEPLTPLGRWTARGLVTPTPDQRYADEFLLADERLTSAGFEHYEVSNFGRPGFRSRHNAAYWSAAPYMGLGPSAHSFTGTTRAWNVREWAEYERRSRAGEPIVSESELLTPDQVALEHRYLGLRTTGGLPAAELSPGMATSWVAEGWATRAGERIRLTPEGWLRLDALVPTIQAP